MLGFTSSLEGTLTLKKAVDYEALKHFKIAIRAQVSNLSPRVLLVITRPRLTT